MKLMILYYYYYLKEKFKETGKYILVISGDKYRSPKELLGIKNNLTSINTRNNNQVVEKLIHIKI
jgi:hypothetical protein